MRDQQPSDPWTLRLVSRLAGWLQWVTIVAALPVVMFLEWWFWGDGTDDRPGEKETDNGAEP